MFLKKMLLEKGFNVKIMNKSEAIQISKELDTLGYKWQDGDAPLEWFPPKHLFPVYYEIHVNIVSITYCELYEYSSSWDGFYNFRDIWKGNVIYKEV
jgi:hypothetical protein